MEYRRRHERNTAASRSWAGSTTLRASCRSRFTNTASSIKRPSGKHYKRPMINAKDAPARRVSPLAGKPATPAMLVDVPRLVTAYYTEVPDSSVPAQRVAFGTSGHRGSAFESTFNEWHVLAISQAICDYRKRQGIGGPLFLGIDTHALSVPACASALEVLAANGVDVMLAEHDEYTPTPVISHAILTYNRGRTAGFADGIVITPSHNPPDDGGFKYNPPNGGPADNDVTGWIEARANALLESGLQGVHRIPYEKALRAATTHRHDFLNAYVSDLGNVLDMDAIRGANISMGVDPLGGAGVHYWGPIAERYGLNLTVVNEVVDPTFRFMTVDWDGRIRMDPSSSYAMQSLIGLKDRFDIAFACDTDHDRHGIVTRSAGLLPPNHYLAVAVSLPVSESAKVEQGCGGRQDGGQQPDDRSRRGEARPEALRGAGRIQVVRGRPARRLARLRRRGERRRILPASRRQRLDHGQGRHRPGIAVGGDHRAHGPRSRRNLPRAYARVRRTGLRSRRGAGDPGAETHAGAALATAGSVAGSGRRKDPGHPDPGARQRRGHRRIEGECRERLVRGASVRHRGHLQDLCRELSRRGSSAPHPDGSTGHRRCCAGGAHGSRRCIQEHVEKRP